MKNVKKSVDNVMPQIRKRSLSILYIVMFTVGCILFSWGCIQWYRINTPQFVSNPSTIIFGISPEDTEVSGTSIIFDLSNPPNYTVHLELDFHPTEMKNYTIYFVVPVKIVDLEFSYTTNWEGKNHKDYQIYYQWIDQEGFSIITTIFHPSEDFNNSMNPVAEAHIMITTKQSIITQRVFKEHIIELYPEPERHMESFFHQQFDNYENTITIVSDKMKTVGIRFPTDTIQRSKTFPRTNVYQFPNYSLAQWDFYDEAIDEFTIPEKITFSYAPFNIETEKMIQLLISGISMAVGSSFIIRSLLATSRIHFDLLVRYLKRKKPSNEKNLKA